MRERRGAGERERERERIRIMDDIYIPFIANLSLAQGLGLIYCQKWNSNTLLSGKFTVC